MNYNSTQKTDLHMSEHIQVFYSLLLILSHLIICFSFLFLTLSFPHNPNVIVALIKFHQHSPTEREFLILIHLVISTHFNKIKRSSEKLFIHSFPIVSIANWFGLSSKKSFFFAINFASFFNSFFSFLTKESQQDFFVCDWIVPIRLDFYAYSTFQSWIAFAFSSRSRSLFLSHFWWWRIKEYWLDDISSLFLLCFYLFSID